jgi:tetratricopeptide (TPR) repeat protein
LIPHILVGLAAVVLLSAPSWAEGHAKSGDPDRQGIVLLMRGQYHEAAAAFDAALRRNPKNARALANRCTARYKLGDMPGAIADFEAAVRLKPDLKPTLATSMSDAYYRRAKFWVAKDSDSTAAEFLYTSVRLNRRNASAYCELGFLAVRNRQYDIAVPYFDRALKINPNLAPAYASRAAALMALDHGSAAFSDMDRAILIEPENALYFATRARIAAAIGRHEQSVKDARRAMELDPRQADGLKDLAPAEK